MFNSSQQGTIGGEIMISTYRQVGENDAKKGERLDDSLDDTPPLTRSNVDRNRQDNKNHIAPVSRPFDSWTI